MAKQLNVSLAFSADTSKAKAEIKDLQQTLSQLINTNAKGSELGITKEIHEATVAAAELQNALKNATDMSSGKLSLASFNKELNGKSITEYAQKLASLGPEGQQAFSKIARAITTADVPLKTVNSRLKEFGTTLANTARWQLSSSMLHGFMGAIQSAYGYAQDLNQSLNNIRIVTGANTDEMAQFAVQANKAAQQLSTTTTNYTDAALIYYQQGIRDQDEIAGRVETTIKLANVSRQSAEEVSNQMTAIWNNFYDGSHSLEYYADVITALGAATASSSEEISTGIEKFAAIADTVGLSYKYATSALATIVATTRQSADTVGTGLRTLFSRLQGLSLGETLEDGVDLNKYSKALETVGVSALDASGNLRNMDDILNDLGERWGYLSDAQQTALAQTVGGVRQYTNLIALMDNWDFMKENLEIAEGAEGTLQEQADIYAESWEAAQKRVQASLEEVYNQLLNDDFFIGFTNAIAQVIHGVSAFIDGLGGVKGVLLMIGQIMLQIYQKDITNALDSVANKWRERTGEMSQDAQRLREQTNEALRSLIPENGGQGDAAQATGYTNQAAVQDAYLQKMQQMSEMGQQISSQDQAKLQAEMDILEVKNNQVVKSGEELSSLEKGLELEVQRATLASRSKDNTDNKEFSKDYENQLTKLQQLRQQYGMLESAIVKVKQAQSTAKNKDSFDTSDIEKFIQKLREMDEGFDELDWDEAFDDKGHIKNLDSLLQQLENNLDKVAGDSDEAAAAARDLEGALQMEESAVDGVISSATECGNAMGGTAEAMINADNGVEHFGQTLDNLQPKFASVSDAIVSVGSAASAYGMALSSMTRIGDIFTDDDTSIMEKIIQSFTTLGTVINALNTIEKTATTISSALTGAKMAAATASGANAAALGAEAGAETAAATASTTNTAATGANTAAKTANTTVTGAVVGALGAEATADAAEAAAKGANTGATELNTVAVNLNKVALLSHPIMWIAAIIMAVVAAVSILTKAWENHKKACEEAAKASQEIVDANQEELDKNRDLINTYNEMRQAVANGAASKEDMEKAALAVAEAYDIENAQILIATGRYKELTDQINEAREAELRRSLADTQTAIKDQQEVFMNDMRDGVGHLSGNQYIIDQSDLADHSGRNVEYVSTGDGWTDFWTGGRAQAAGVAKLAQEYMDEQQQNYDLIENLINGSGNISVDSDDIGELYTQMQDYSDAIHKIIADQYAENQQNLTEFMDKLAKEEFGDSYNALGEEDRASIQEILRSRIQQELSDATDEADISKYSSMLDMLDWDGSAKSLEDYTYLVAQNLSSIDSWLEKSADSYAMWQELVNTAAGQKVELSVTEMINPETITNTQEYEEAVQRVTDSLVGLDEMEGKTEDEIRDMVDACMGGVSGLEQLATQATLVAEAADRFGFDKQALSNFYESLENPTLFLQLDFESAQGDIEKLQEQVVTLQVRLDQEQAASDWESFHNANGSFKSGMSSDDYRSFEESSGIDWGRTAEDGTQEIIAYSEFLKMTEEGQAQYLELMEESFYQSNQNMIQKVINSTNEWLTQQNATLEEANAILQEYIDAGDVTSDEYLAQKAVVDGLEAEIAANETLIAQKEEELALNEIYYDKRAQDIAKKTAAAASGDTEHGYKTGDSFKMEDIYASIGNYDAQEVLRAMGLTQEQLDQFLYTAEDGEQTLIGDAKTFNELLAQAVKELNESRLSELDNALDFSNMIEETEERVSILQSDLEYLQNHSAQELGMNVATRNEQIREIEAELSEAQERLEHLKTLNQDFDFDANPAENLEEWVEVLNTLGIDLSEISDTDLAAILKDGADAVTEQADAYQILLNIIHGVQTEYDNTKQSVVDNASSLADLNRIIQEHNLTQDEYIGKQQELIQTALDNAETLNQLKAAYDEVIASGNEFGAGQLEAALIRLAEQYDTCTQELNAYKAALESGNQAQIDFTQANLEVSLAAAEQAKEFNLDAQEIEDLAKVMRETNDELSKGENMLESNAEAATDAAVRFKRLDSGIEDLYDNFDDYIEALEAIQKEENDLDKAMAMNTKTMANFKKALANILDTSEDLIDTNLIDALDPDTLEKAAMGDADAIREIQHAFIDAQMEGQNFGQTADELKNYLDNLAEGQVINLDETPAITAMVAAMLQAGATADEIEARLSGMGIDCDVTEFDAAMDDIANSSAEAAAIAAANGDAIVDANSFDASVQEVQADSTDTQEDTAFEETVTMEPKTGDVVVPEGDGSVPKEYTATVPEFHKTVNPVTQTEEDTKQQTVRAVKLSNAHKSAGGNVSHNRQTSTSPKGGGGKSGSCFIAGTLISTATGFEKIENIRPGNIVLSYNEEKQRNEYSEVLQTMIHITNELIYHIQVGNEILSATGIHRFLITHNGISEWLMASKLVPGDLMFFADGTLHEIENITTEIQFTTVYNFEVSNTHNYYVGKNRILAHNKGGGSCFVAGTPVLMEKGYFKNIEEVQKGDIVLSYNEKLNKNEYSEVVQTMTHITHEEIYSLYVKNDILQATGIHRFFVLRNGELEWLQASELQIGDKVLFADGSWHYIKKIETKVEFLTVYNFEVANNHNYYVGHNSILAHNKGGGGGKTKTKDPKKGKEADDEIERYHVIKAQIDDVTRNLNKMSEAKDRAFGKQRVKLINDEITAQKTLNNHTKKYIDQIKKYKGSFDGNNGKGTGDAGALKQAAAELGVVLKRDSNDNITNYEEYMKAALSKYNQAIEAYNAVNPNNEEAEEAAKKALEEAEEQYEKYKKILEKYEETNDLLQEQEEELRKGLQEVYDKVTEKNEYIIDLRIDFDDSVLKFIDYLQDKIDNFSAGTLQDMTKKLLLLNREADTLTDKSNTANNGIDRTLNHYLVDGKGYSKEDAKVLMDKFKSGTLTDKETNIFADMTEEEMNYIQSQMDTLLDTNEAMMEMYDKVVDNVKEGFEKTSHDLEQAAKPIQRAADSLQNYSDIIGITGRDYLKVSTGLMKDLRQAQVDVAINQVGAAKAKLDALVDERDKVQKLYDQAIAEGDAVMAKKWKDALEEMNDEVDSATADFDQKWQKALDGAREAWKANIEDNRKDWLDAIAGPDKSWDELKETMDYTQQAAERFVPEYEKIYELSKLNRDINKSIDDTDNVKNKKALRDLQKEINKLAEEGVEVSQYDLDNARRQYELELARLELEESKNVKDTVRLSKDSEGNWSYIYTADEQDVADAEQNYEDKLFAMQQANADYINELQNNILQMEEDCINKIAEIEADELISADEKARRIAEIQQFKAEQEKYYTGELEKATENNKTLYEKDYTWYANYTAEKSGADSMNAAEMAANNVYRLADQDKFVTDWSDTFLGMNTGYTTADDFLGKIKKADETAMSDMKAATLDWVTNNNNAMQEAGIKLDETGQAADGFKSSMEEAMKTAQTETEKARGEISQLRTQLTSDFAAMTAETSKWQSQYSMNIQKIILDNEKLMESIGKVLDKFTEVEDWNTDDGTDNSEDGTQPEDGGGKGGGNNSDEDSNKQKAREKYLDYKFTGNTPNRNYYLSGKYVGSSSNWTKDAQIIQALINGGVWGKNYGSGSWTIYHPESADSVFKRFGLKTGGYTGDWSGDDGRLALLHQKELVLNAGDTENMLKSIEIVRSIAKTIDLNAQSTAYSTGNLSAASAASTNSQLEQTVTITAEFPNATDRNEIAEAFKTLVNEASQYANRKNF